MSWLAWRTMSWLAGSKQDNYMSIEDGNLGGIVIIILTIQSAVVPNNN